MMTPGYKASDSKPEGSGAGGGGRLRVHGNQLAVAAGDFFERASYPRPYSNPYQLTISLDSTQV